MFTIAMNFDQIKKSLKSKSVGIAGCGGLGSNCAVALARVGVGKLIIVDFPDPHFPSRPIQTPESEELINS